MQQQLVQGDALDFDANMYNPEQGPGQLPLGTHKVVVERSEKKETQAGGSGMLILHLRIIEGDMAGITGGWNFNLWHQTSPKACEIAHDDLSALCHVLGEYMLKNTAQLFGKPFFVEVVQNKKNPDYTDIKKVFDINMQPPRRKGNAPPAAQPANVVNNTQTAPVAQQAVNQAQQYQQPPQQMPGSPPAYQGHQQGQPQMAPAQQPQQQGQPNAPWNNQQPAQAPAQQMQQGQAPTVANAPWNNQQAPQQGGAPQATPPWAQ